MGAIGLLLGVFLAPHWFARSGSLMVLFGAAATYVLLQMEADTLYGKLASREDVGSGPSNWQKYKGWMAHSTVALGTVIWGFGDLLLGLFR